MIKKTVTYKDFNGNTRTDDFYFNLTKAELVDMEMGVDGGMKEMLEKIVAEKDQRKMYEYFKDMVIKAYGVKTPDGRGFEKSEKIRNSFAPTEAYSIIFMELATNTEKAIEFVNGIIPQPEEPVGA